MLRPARVCLVFLALAGAACSEERESQDPNQPAGKVIEMAGGVSAAREGAASRPLAVGAAVFADDTVTTGTDGSAAILLAHNQVRWNLGGDKSVRVDRSLAWKASSDQSGSAFDDQDEMATASAGRHTDREAGDTAATAQLPPAAQEAAPAEGAPAAPPPADSYASAGTSAKGKSSRSPAPPARKESSATRGGGMLAKKSVSGSGNGSGDKLLDEPSGGGGGAVSRAAAAAAPVAPESKKAESLESAPAPEPAAKPIAGTLVFGKLTVKGALTAAQVTGKLAALGRGCRATATGKLTVHLDIDGKGAVTNVRLAGASTVTAPISACVIAGARKLAFPPSSGTTSVEREITIR